MNIHSLQQLPFAKSVFWTLLLCMIVVAAAALLARATLNLDAALLEKPDLAVYLLRPQVTSAELLRAGQIQREYVAQTDQGPELLTLRKEKGQWRVADESPLHE